MKRLMLSLAIIGFNIILSACVRIELITSTNQPGQTQPGQNPPSPGSARVSYSGTRLIVTKAVNDANKVLQNSEFYKAIREKNDFTYTKVDPAEIANLIQQSRVRVNVRLYDGEPGSTTNAYVTSKYPNTLFLNSDKLNRSSESITNTIIHEVVHAVDASADGIRFGHGTNSRIGKGNSAPYWIGSLAGCISKDGKPCSSKGLKAVDPDDEIEEMPILDDEFIFD
jgi:hypothetical protein